MSVEINEIFLLGNIFLRFAIKLQAKQFTVHVLVLLNYQAASQFNIQLLKRYTGTDISNSTTHIAHMNQYIHIVASFFLPSQSWLLNTWLKHLTGDQVAGSIPPGGLEIFFCVYKYITNCLLNTKQQVNLIYVFLPALLPSLQSCCIACIIIHV